MATTTPRRAEPLRHTSRRGASPSVRNNALRVGTIGGIQIYIDWTWLLAFAFFTWSLGAYYDATFHSWGHTTAYLIGTLSTILLFVTVLLHEVLCRDPEVNEAQARALLDWVRRQREQHPDLG